MKKTNWAKLTLLIVIAVLFVVSLAACGKVYTVTFDSNGGSAVGRVEVKNNETLEAPAAPTRNGYTFEKWLKPDGTEFKFGTDTITGNITLTASWRINTYTVTFDTNGGSQVASQSINYNGNVSRPQEPTKAGQVFVGWYEDSGFLTPFNFSEKKIVQNTTIYARFVDKIDEIFTVAFSGTETAIAPRTTNEGGVLTDLPQPQESGKEFAGWWMSDFEDAEKLTSEYTGQVLKQNITLYAVWRSDRPLASVNENGVTWESMGVNVSYRVEITAPDLTKETRTVGTTEYEYDFGSKPAGEYVITVTYNNKTTTVYYNNKALARVCLFEVNGFELQFNAVANAQKYLITIECGNTSSEHVAGHTQYDNGASTVFDFSQCEMRAEGIRFVVKAIAEGYIGSESEEYVFERHLEEVTGLSVKAEDETIVWNNVSGAQYYEYKINDGAWTRYDRAVSLKEMEPGEIRISVRAVAHGYNNSEPAEYTYIKTRLATPVEITVDGDELKWNAVTGAESYTVLIDGTEYPATGNSMRLPADADWTSMQISVRANGATEAENSLYSDVKRFAATLEGRVEYKNGSVVWSSIVGAVKYGVKINDGEETELVGSVSSFKIEFVKKGINKISVRFYNALGKPSEWETIEVEVFAVTLSYNFAYQGDFATLYRVVGDDLCLPGTDEVTTEGYTFKFWSATETGLAYLETALTDAADLTLYAQWDANKYNVTLFPSGGSVDGETEAIVREVTYRERFTLPVVVPDEVTKAFAGWYTSPNSGGVKMTDNYGNSVNTWTSLSDITLYPGYVDIFVFKLITNPETLKQEYSVQKGDGISLVSEVTVPHTYNGLAVGEVASGAFESCNYLVTVNIPDTIRLIDMSLGGNQTGSPFKGCTRLENVNIYYVEGNHERLYASVDGVLFYKNTVAGGVELKYYPFARTGSYTIPFGTQVISANVFRGYTKLDEIYIPASVYKIDVAAFQASTSTALKKVEFLSAPEQPTDEIGLLEVAAAAAGELIITGDAFRGCTALTQVILPARLSSFDVFAFNGCTSLESIDVEDGCTSYASVDGMLSNAEKTKIICCPVGRKGDLRIPSGISTIGESAFENCKLITSISIPGYVTLIEKNAFKSCTGVTSVVFEGIADDLSLEIGEGAFYGCKASTTLAISEITLPANLKKLGKNAFGGISTLTRVVVNSIGEVEFASGAFANTTSSATTYLTDLYLCKDVFIADIGGVFGIKVANVTIASENPYYKAIDNVVYDVDVTRIIFYPTGKEGAYTTPETVTVIGEKVFMQKTGLTEITIGKNVTEIGDYAFSGCKNLGKVTFEDGTAALTIGSEAFSSCSLLEDVSLPTRLTTIGSGAFKSCRALVEITVPEGVTEIGAEAFQWCSALTTISLPSTLEKIGYTTEKDILYMYLFRYCNALEEINVAQDNEYFVSQNGILYGKTDGKITDLYPVPVNNSGIDGVVTVPDTLTKVWSGAFKDNVGLLKIDFGGVTGNVEFGKEVFYNCKNLSEVVLPDGIAAIGHYMFYQCNSLTEITIPNTVQVMENQAFYYCNNLSIVTFAPGNDANELTLKGSYSAGYDYTIRYPVFDHCDKLTSLSFPKRLKVLGDYALTATNISEVSFADDTILSEIGKYALYMAEISSVVIPANVVQIGEFAFSRCASLSSVEFAEGSMLEIINTSVFSYTSFTEIEIPASVTRIGNSAFGYSKLETITFAENSKLVSIGNGAFQKSAIKAIEIPATVEEIGEDIPTSPYASPSHGYAFDGCRNLVSVTFQAGSKLKAIYIYAFRNTAIGEFRLPSSENEIELEKQLFFGCNNLTYIYVSENVLNNLDQALMGCPVLETVEISAQNTSYSVNDELPLVSNVSGNSIIYFFTALNGKNSEVVIPDGTLDIENSAFKNQVYITKVTIPASVMQIGQGAFQNCFALEEVNFVGTSALQSIGNGAFTNCLSLKKINLPLGVTSYGTYLFANCASLEEITLPADMKTLPNYTFDKCTSLSSVIMPEGLTTIGRYAFRGCTSLSGIDISNVKTINTYAFTQSGLTSITIPTTITTIGNYLFNGCSKLATINWHDNITSIGTSVFKDCVLLSNVVLPSGLKTLGTNAFQNCTSLTSITIPGLVTTLPNNLFDGCSNLSSVTLPASVTTFGNYVFQGCTALESIDLPSNLTYLGRYTFKDSGLVSIVLPNNIEHISHKAATKANTGTSTTNDVSLFENCVNLQSVVLPGGLLSIGPKTFMGCVNLSSVTYSGYDGKDSFALPDSVYVLGACLFSGCATLQSVTLPSGGSNTLTAGTYLFDGCSGLESVVFPETGWTQVYASMFRDCASLESIVMPDSIKTLGTYAFYGCTALERVSLSPNITSISGNAFEGCISLGSINIPEEVTSIGASAFFGSGLTYVVIPQKVKTIYNMAFSDCEYLEEVIVDGLNATFRSEDGIVYNRNTGALVFVPSAKKDLNIDVEELLLNNGITAYAFYGVTGIEHITVPEGVTSIPAYAFYGLASLKSVTLPGTLRSLGDYAFAYTALESITLPDSMVVEGSAYTGGGYMGSKILGKGIFRGCLNLTSVTLPEGLWALSDSLMFEGCISLKEIHLPDSLVFLGVSTFANSGLESIVFPSNVKYLSYSANSPITDSRSSAIYTFQNCVNLTSVTLNDGLIQIWKNAFEGCVSLQSINLPDSLELVGGGAFVRSGLKSVSIPASLTKLMSSSYDLVHGYSFSSIDSLTTVTIEEGAELIPNSAFANCASLETVILPETITLIGYSAFANCSSLSNFVLPQSVVEINGSAFLNCTSIKSLLIYPNTAVAGVSIFEGWTAEQTIYIMESQYVVSNYWYGPVNATSTNNWFANCNAKIVYDYTPAQD
ncbi:MAG: leucine-rich repeat protein [Clostridia bacterium]|nr:leucine-rich repeat protein [Clostridia bacterium]